jgi:hypothetical protein
MVNRILAGSITVCTLLIVGQQGARAQSSTTRSQSSTQSSGQTSGQTTTQSGRTSTQVASTQDQVVTVPFSDPSRPGTVKVSLLSGGITVRAGSGRDVIVTTSRDGDEERERERAEREREREQRRRERGDRERDDDPGANGLRRLTQPYGVNITEENNTVTVTAPMTFGGVGVTLQVPAATSVELRSVNGGQITVEGINGSIDVNNVNGSIRIADAGGPVIAHATNGRVVATLRQVPSGKPMSFTSFNGNVDVTLPGSAKANLKMRSDRGDVYTDFEVQTTGAPTPQARQSGDRGSRDSRGRYRLDMDRSIYGTINGGGADFELRTFNGNIYLRKAQ